MTNPVVVVASISEDMTYDKLDMICEILMGYFRYSNLLNNSIIFQIHGVAERYTKADLKISLYVCVQTFLILRILELFARKVCKFLKK